MLKKMLQKALGPIVSIEYTFLLFASAIVHLVYFGEAHPLKTLDTRLPHSLKCDEM